MKRNIVVAFLLLLSHHGVSQHIFSRIADLPENKLKEVFFPIVDDAVFNEDEWDGSNYADESFNRHFRDINGKIYNVNGFVAGDHFQRLVCWDKKGFWIISTDGNRRGPFNFDEIYSFKDNYLKIKKMGKWGLADLDGVVRLKAAYDELDETEYLIMVEQNGKYGLLDFQLRIVQPCVYDYLSAKGDYFLVGKNDLYGWLDAKTGEVLVQCKYTYPYYNEHIEGQLMPVGNKTGEGSAKHGLCNRAGEMVVPMIYDRWKQLNGLYVMDRSLGNFMSTSDLFDEHGKKIVSDCSIENIKVFKYDNSIDTIVFYRKEWDALFALNINSHDTKRIDDDGVRHMVVGDFSQSNHRFGVVTQTISKEPTWKHKYGVYDLAFLNYIIPLGDNVINEVIPTNPGVFILHSYDEKRLTFVRAYYNSEMTVLSRLNGVEAIGEFRSWGDDLEPKTQGWNLWRVRHSDGTVGLINSLGTYVFQPQERMWIYPEAIHNDDDYDNFKPTGPYILCPRSGLYDRNGKLLIEGDFDQCETMFDGKCIVLYHQGSNMYRPRYRDFYLNEEGVIKKINEGFNSFSEMIFWYIKKKSEEATDNVDNGIPQGKQSRDNLYAFIIANQNYPENEVAYALNDGKIFREYCSKTLGINNDHIFFYKNATTGSMIRCVEGIKQATRANNGNINVIFYYAGHAFPDEDTKAVYLLPVDGDSKITATGYSLSKLYSELGSIQAHSMVCFIDACFSGATREGGMLTEGRGVAIKIKEDIPQGNVVVFTSATGVETAHEYKAKRHGMFTYFLLKKLQESKGDVTLGELAEYITTNVKRSSFDENGTIQTPTVIPSPKLQNTWRNIRL